MWRQVQAEIGVLHVAQQHRVAQQDGGEDHHRLQHDPEWKDNVLFNEYFHGDNGAGLGASHQTGWTGLVASLIDEWRR